MTWQPIETAPKDGTFIDLWVEEEDEVAIAYYAKEHRITDCVFRDGHWRHWDDFFYDWTVIDVAITHWMPRPEPPTKS